MDRGRTNLPPRSKEYPPYSLGPGMEMPMASLDPQTRPPRYAYPPVPVRNENAAVTHQPSQRGYMPPPYGGGGYLPPRQPRYEGPAAPNLGYPQSPPVMAEPLQMQAAEYGSPGQILPLNVPPGLEYLTQLDRLIVKQRVELLEAFVGIETNNKYKVKDSQGRDLYTAKEDSDCCARNFCGPIRPFEMTIKDMSGREVIHLSRPFACCLQRMEVFSPPGQLAGTVEAEWRLCIPQFSVKDAQGNVVLKIEGSMCGSVEFKVLSPDGATKVGKISKQWSGLLREVFTDADNFGISFPIDLDVKMKAVMLGACFLIDFMYFEDA